MNNIIELSAARDKAPSDAALPADGAEILTLPSPADTEDEDELDRTSEIMLAAVAYTSINGGINGAWRAEQTGNSTVANVVTQGMHERRDAALRKLTRLMGKTNKVRTVELWSLASVADVVMNQSGDEESGGNLEPFEIHFLRSLFRLVERDCESRERGR